MGTVWGQGGFLGPLDSEGPISPGWGSAGREKEVSRLESSVNLARLHMLQLYTHSVVRNWARCRDRGAAHFVLSIQMWVGEMSTVKSESRQLCYTRKGAGSYLGSAPMNSDCNMNFTHMLIFATVVTNCYSDFQQEWGQLSGRACAQHTRPWSHLPHQKKTKQQKTYKN